MVDPTENLISELRRGTLVLSVLSQLQKQQYGYSLKEQLSIHNIEIDQGTLYPLLRRLESQGLLDSEWVVSGSRPRRYYRLSDTGQEVLDTLSHEWQMMVEAINHLLNEREDNTNGTD
ncbi:MAG: PadR family transcriptional regulator [Anaerolineae bacterium]|nr:PadR family transcriptional regulator [Anaerolineae bacterium]